MAACEVPHVVTEVGDLVNKAPDLVDEVRDAVLNGRRRAFRAPPDFQV
jgi:hypothetical protein